MMKHCNSPDPCYEDGVCRYTRKCVHQFQTNADRIRSMSDEELAEFLAQLDPRCHNCPADAVCCGCNTTPPRDCADWFEEWLKQPAEECE